MTTDRTRRSRYRPRRDGRGRNYLPAATVVVVLALASIVAWTTVFVSSTSNAVTSCNPSPVPGLATAQRRTTLDDQTPAPPGDVQVRVLNGAGQRGQATLAAVELGELGIAEAAPPDNDPRYPAQDLSCVGQIRYGPQGAAAARTLSLVVPCAELIRDDRGGRAVDLALGSDFRDIAPNQEVTSTLRDLSRRAASPQSAAAPDQSSISALREVDCST